MTQEEFEKQALEIFRQATPEAKEQMIALLDTYKDVREYSTALLERLAKAASSQTDRKNPDAPPRAGKEKGEGV